MSNDERFTTNSRKTAPTARTSSEYHPKYSSASIEERRRISTWLNKRKEDKHCMKGVKFTPSENKSI